MEVEKGTFDDRAGPGKGGRPGHGPRKGPRSRGYLDNLCQGSGRLHFPWKEPLPETG